MIVYAKLWIMLQNKGLKRMDLVNDKVISTATLAKLSKNERVSLEIIEKLCRYLKCQPGDIMEVVTEEDVIKAGEIFNEKMSEALKLISTVTGKNTDALLNEFLKEAPNLVEQLKSGNMDFAGVENLKKKASETE